MLEVTIDRRLLDSQIVAGRDLPFTVLVDGKPAPYKEISATPAQRTLVMPVADDAKSVTIVGRQMSVDILGYGEANAAIDRAEKAIAKFRGEGVVVTNAESVFLDGRDAFVPGKYHFAASLANRTTNLASSAGRTAQAAAQAMSVAGSSINATRTLGISVPEAE